MESQSDKNWIKEFIKDEMHYFQPMIGRSKKYNKSELENFRNETIKQRKLRISKELFDQLDGEVKYGIFKGMKMYPETWWGSLDLGLMCLGEYEKEIIEELHEGLGKIANPRTFIDIGAADGYYAVGVLHSRLAEKCICFELNQNGQKNIIKNHKLNNSPGKLEVYGDVFENFKQVISINEIKNSLILIDIEGAEFNFLNKEMLSQLKEATLLIEVHNWVDDFEETYREFLINASEFFKVKKILSSPRNFNGFEEELRSFTDDNRALLFSESRPCQMRFLKMTPL